MIIPIKKIILEMSTALKRRKAFQQAGIIPPKNEYGYNFPQKKIFKKITNNNFTNNTTFYLFLLNLNWTIVFYIYISFRCIIDF